MTMMFIGIDAAIVLLSAGIMIFVILRWRKKKSSEIKVVTTK